MGGKSYLFVGVVIGRVMLPCQFYTGDWEGDIQSIVSLAFWSRASSPADDIVLVIAKQK